MSMQKIIGLLGDAGKAANVVTEHKRYLEVQLDRGDLSGRDRRSLLRQLEETDDLLAELYDVSYALAERAAYRQYRKPVAGRFIDRLFERLGLTG